MILVAGVLVILVALLFELRDLLLPGFVAIAVPLLAVVAVGLWRPALEISRRFEPAAAPAGSATTVLLSVRNRGRSTLDGAVWTDEAPAGLYPPEQSVLPAIGPRERILASGDDTARLAYRLQLPRRGVYAVGPLRVGITDPFGLASATKSYGEAREIVVTPRVIPLDAGGTGTASIDGGLHSLMRRTHPNSDELIAREYRHGDPFRRVHWRQTARRGELMVRQEEQRGDPEAVLLLDSGLAGRMLSDEELQIDGTVLKRGFEFGVEIAASIGVRLLEEGFRVRFGETADPAAAAGERRTVLFEAPGGGAGLLEYLARIDQPGEAPAHGRAATGRASDPLPGIAGRAKRGLFAVLVDPDLATAEALAAAGSSFEPRIAVVLDTVDPAVVEVLERQDWRCLDVYRAAELQLAWAGLGEGAKRAGADAR